MKIAILENVGNFGVPLLAKNVDGKAFLRDELEVEIDREGTLKIGDRYYKVEGGSVKIPEYFIAQGSNKLIFADSTGTYDCGKLFRNGRFISTESMVENINVQLALAYERQGEEIRIIKAELKELREKYGINII